MQFKLYSLLTILVSALTVQAAVDANTLVNSLNQLTKVTKETNGIVKDINTVNSFTTAPRLIDNLREIVQLTSSTAQDLSDGVETSASEEDQKKICDALTDYIAANDELTHTLSNKAGVLGDGPFGAPIGAVTRILEGGVDAVVFGSVDAAPYCAADVKDAIDSLNNSFEEVIGNFS